MTDPQQEVLNYLAEAGEYYDSFEEIPTDILRSKLEAMERVLGMPERFPHANFDRMEEIYPSLVAAAAGRMIFV